jgi:hypothetical protein
VVYINNEVVLSLKGVFVAKLAELDLYHHVKWNKPVPKWQVLYAFIHLWNLGGQNNKSKNKIKQKMSWKLRVVEGEGDWGRGKD